MEKRTIPRVISTLLIVSSIIIFVFGEKNILGFAIAKPQAIQLNYLIAIILFVAGLILFFVQQLLEEKIRGVEFRPILGVQEIRENINELAKNYERGKIELGEAVMSIDRIANVKPIDYSRGYFSPIHLDEHAFTFESGKLNSKVPIRMHDMEKKRALFYGLLELTFRKQRRGIIDSRHHIRPDIQIKVGKNIESSKHHPELVHSHIQDYDKEYSSIFDRYLAEYFSK